ncbi:cytokine receptor family member B16 isoform X2 [Neoarius graeffei]|uniref:cytokine receptor family member B16 isoform X2 n=1 Tax=Neoarius graeffei TaxID=443677 RepID=UPI00298D1E2A|nr:cytokine receptor family member B16 isoform X2 [Neoarius graeffei]
MFQTREVLKIVTSAFLIATLSHAALLPASLNVSICSENMRHILRWSSVQETCCSVNYTVKYQGEFEYMQNDSWQDEHSCSEIVRNECDLTLALSSDSDYNISVLTRCDDSTLWTQLPKTFNRKDTVLLAPNMSVNPGVGQIEVSFSELHNHIKINLTVWKKGDEHNFFSKDVTGQKVKILAQPGYWQGGGMYCLKAEAKLDITNKTKSTEVHCVHVQEPLSLVPVAVGITVALTLTMALILGLTMPRCSLWLRKNLHTKEALPTALLDWSKTPLVFPPNTLLEPTHSIVLLADLAKEPDRMSETKAACDEEMSSPDT